MAPFEAAAGAETITRQPSASRPSEAELGCIVGVLVFVALLWVPALLNDGDTLWHIRAGEWILRHRAVPFVDHFSYTMAGRPWVAHEWLSEIFLALADRLAGWSGVMALTAAAAGAAAGLLATHLARLVRLSAAIPLFLLAAGCLLPSLLARPHILALPCFEIWTAALVMARRRGAAPSLLLLPLMTLWANLHGGFIVGLALAAALGLEAAAEAGRRWREPARSWGLFLLGGTLAALATPHFIEGLLFPFQLLELKDLDRIQEWSPGDVGHLTALALSVLLALYLALTGQLRLTRFRALLVTALIFSAFQHARNGQLVGIMGSLLLAGTPGAFGSAPAAQVPSRRLRFLLPLIPCVAVLGLTARLAFPFMRQDGRVYATAALDHVPAPLRAQPVLNAYQFGGFLIFSGVRPFIDGRADMYGGQFLHTYLQAMHPDEAVLNKLLDKYQITWTLLSPDSPALPAIEARPGWRRLYADKIAVVDVKDAALFRH